jgi:hypothetical protein
MEKQELCTSEDLNELSLDNNSSPLKKETEKELSIDHITNELSKISLDNNSSILKKEVENNSKSYPKDKKSKKLPIYIGTCIDEKDIDSIIESSLDSSFLEDKNKKKEFHVTLSFKPKKEQKDQIPNEETPCDVYLEGIGYSNDAIALKVEKILTNSGENVPSFLKEDGILHITIALAENIKPANSYLAITDGTYKKFEEILCIKGNIKYYYG